MADTSKYTIEERLIVSLWVLEKEQTGETYEEIRETSFFVSLKQISQSPRIPDLTTCDNWLWYCLKENLSVIWMDSVEQLKRAIIRIFRTITPEMLKRASIQLCAENVGAHTEMLDV